MLSYQKLIEIWTRGFGYLDLSNEYKFVEIYRLRTDLNIVEVLVYTLGSGNGWRNVGRFDFQSDKAGHVEKGVFVNGALHWMEIEQGSTCYGYSLVGVSGGVLYHGIKYYCRITKSICYDIWPLKGKNDIGDMKEQVEQETLGWGKEFVFHGRQPFSFTKSGGVLYFDDRSLGIYNAVASTSKELVRFSGVSQIYPYKNTFVSLKELGEDDVKIMDAAKSSEDRKPCFSATELAR